MIMALNVLINHLNPFERLRIISKIMPILNVGSGVLRKWKQGYFYILINNQGRNLKIKVYCPLLQ